MNLIILVEFIPLVELNYSAPQALLSILKEIVFFNIFLNNIMPCNPKMGEKSSCWDKI